MLADELGCAIEDVETSLVQDLEQTVRITNARVGRVEDHVLQACGAFVGAIGPARVVYVNGCCYVEGILDFVMDEARRKMGPEGLKEFLGR